MRKYLLRLLALALGGLCMLVAQNAYAACLPGLVNSPEQGLSATLVLPELPRLSGLEVNIAGRGC